MKMVKRSLKDVALVEPMPNSVPSPLVFPINGQMSPGTKTVTAIYSAIASNYIVQNPTTNLTINKENADVEYTGSLSVATSSTSSGAAVITLNATLRDITAVSNHPDTDANRGDIRNARIRFLRDGVPVVNNSATNGAITDGQGWTRVGLVNSTDITTGTVLIRTNVDIGNADAVPYTFRVELSSDSYYEATPEDFVVNVYKPLNDFITGGGYIIPTRSNGTYAADAGRKSNFGFNVRYNKTGKSLQGNINVIFRRKKVMVSYIFTR
jgi:hypothetical protein